MKVYRFSAVIEKDLTSKTLKKHIRGDHREAEGVVMNQKEGQR